MAVTPEGKIKKLVNKMLDEFVVDLASPQLYRYWPVPSGFGESSLDCIVCYYGVFMAIETKAPGKKPTPRQQDCMMRMRCAGGIVHVVDSPDDVEKLRNRLLLIKLANDKHHS